MANIHNTALLTKMQEEMRHKREKRKRKPKKKIRQAETPKPRSTDPEKDLKHIAYAALTDGGMPRATAARALGYSPNSVSGLDVAADRKSQKISIVTDQRVALAHRAVDKLIRGKKFGCIETVKDSTALRAAEVVLDRAEPKVGDQVPANISFTKVDLTIYQTHLATTTGGGLPHNCSLPQETIPISPLEST